MAQKTLDTVTRDALVAEIAARVGVRAERGRRFAELTSLRVGGAIDWVIVPETEEQAAAVVGALDEACVPWRVLGAGSNVLADDEQHAYVVVTMREVKGKATFDGEKVSVSAGYSLPRLCVDAARKGLSGIEGLNGIPGTVGGALWMNAGAFGHEIGGVVETVRVARGGTVVEVPGEKIKWDYRHTSFRDGELVLGATLVLRADDVEKINARMEESKRRRMETQPHGSRSAGCFFKNPPGSGLSTGKMIDEMGMKGERRGGAQVSPVHANFIVTEGEGARAADALALAEEIRERIRREHGIELEYEVELWRGNTPEAAKADDTQTDGAIAAATTQDATSIAATDEAATHERAKGAKDIDDSDAETDGQ
ncbi:MAG: UDP-N-acetylmuramate dehydrogenase [Acidobacteriota bacterium]|jgi:UDP-N-acetylmuramate dehydrogenase|nr:UDP-N-acetylmuramate dehydrogenase [Acidobacteriota bacterium]